jgi:hypothetical protein
MKKFKVRQGYVISTKEEREQKIDDKTLSIIPAFKFLLKFPDAPIPKAGKQP